MLDTRERKEMLIASYKSTNAMIVKAAAMVACKALSLTVSNLRLSLSLRPIATTERTAILFKASNSLLKLNIAQEIAVINACNENISPVKNDAN